MGDYALRYFKTAFNQNVTIFKQGDFDTPTLVLDEYEFEKLYKEFKKQQKEWVKR